MPSSVADSGTPMTGKSEHPAMTPARWAALPGAGDDHGVSLVLGGLGEADCDVWCLVGRHDGDGVLDAEPFEHCARFFHDQAIAA